MLFGSVLFLYSFVYPDGHQLQCKRLIDSTDFYSLISELHLPSASQLCFLLFNPHSSPLASLLLLTFCLRYRA